MKIRGFKLYIFAGLLGAKVQLAIIHILGKDRYLLQACWKGTVMQSDQFGEGRELQFFGMEFFKMVDNLHIVVDGEVTAYPWYIDDGVSSFGPQRSVNLREDVDYVVNVKEAVEIQEEFGLVSGEEGGEHPLNTTFATQELASGVDLVCLQPHHHVLSLISPSTS